MPPLLWTRVFRGIMLSSGLLMCGMWSRWKRVTQQWTSITGTCNWCQTFFSFKQPAGRRINNCLAFKHSRFSKNFFAMRSEKKLVISHRKKRRAFTPAAVILIVKKNLLNVPRDSCMIVLLNVTKKEARHVLWKYSLQLKCPARTMLNVLTLHLHRDLSSVCFPQTAWLAYLQ